MRPNIYTDSTLLAAAQKSQEELITTALRLGYDNVELAKRMNWLKDQPLTYRLKVAKAVEKINGTSSADHTRVDGQATAQPIQDEEQR